jgi:hypothetical protein
MAERRCASQHVLSLSYDINGATKLLPCLTLTPHVTYNRAKNGDQFRERKKGANIDEMAPTSPRVTSRDYPRPSTPGLIRRLPLPGSPGSSWQVYRDRIGNALLSRGFRTAAAFFIFGLINNILFVIVLSVSMSVPAVDLLVGSTRLGWTNRTQIGCAIGRRDASVSL